MYLQNLQQDEIFVSTEMKSLKGLTQMESRRGLEKIPSSGGLSEGLSKQESFEGFIVPRNKELMRIFNDLELVEQLGSGIPCILGHYGKESFIFSIIF